MLAGRVALTCTASTAPRHPPRTSSCQGALSGWSAGRPCRGCVGASAGRPSSRPSLLVCGAAGKGSAAGPDDRPVKEICRNRKATFNYEVLEKFECGLELQGSEVKSIRAGQVSLQDAFCKVIDGEMILLNTHVAPNQYANEFDNHDATRMRRLLLRKKEILKIRQKTEEKGLALVPLRMYFRASWVKVEIAVARGKNTVDKRDDIRKKDAKRDLARISKLQY